MKGERLQIENEVSDKKKIQPTGNSENIPLKTILPLKSQSINSQPFQDLRSKSPKQKQFNHYVHPKTDKVLAYSSTLILAQKTLNHTRLCSHKYIPPSLWKRAANGISQQEA